jgi:DNA/RNA endonuclease YhcR with UshA esterase domain
VDIGRTSDGKVNFLNFHKEWRGKFYMVIFSDLAKKLPKSVEQTFLNKTVRVKGKVEEHRGRPQIKILSMDQVKFVGE